MLCFVSQSTLYRDKSQDLCSTSDFMTLSIHKHPLSDLHPLWFTISAISSESGVFHVLCISNRYVIVRPSDDLLFKRGVGEDGWAKPLIVIDPRTRVNQRAHTQSSLSFPDGFPRGGELVSSFFRIVAICPLPSPFTSVISVSMELVRPGNRHISRLENYSDYGKSELLWRGGFCLWIKVRKINYAWELKFLECMGFVS